MKINGNTIVITGGATGIGFALAKEFIKAENEVIICGRRELYLKEAKKKLPQLHIRVCDVSKERERKELFQWIYYTFNDVNILVNNAGIIRRTPAIDFSEKDWDEVMLLNSKTVFFLSQACARDMMKRNYGKIINIASLLAFQGGIFVPSYAASKGAVAQMTKSMANEWAKEGITINAIAPGYMATNNTKALREDPVRTKSILDRIPANRWGTPSDVKGVAVFLASPASDYVNGHVLVVDGGWMAR